MKSSLPVVVLAAILPLAQAAAPSAELFVRKTPSATIYHDGWIDLNKNGRKDPYEDRRRPVEDRIGDLLGQMTMEEKTAQMVTLYGYPRVLKDELPTDEWRTEFWKDGIGNIDEHINGNRGATLNLKAAVHDQPGTLHVQAINEVQRWFIEQTRLGIPVDFSNEGIRGLVHSKASSFPAQLAVAATFDRELVRNIGRITGREARALGYTNVYSPILDLARDPRWGRTTETYGEDPYLVSELGIQQVRGIQEQNVVATLKHFAVYSIPKGGRDGQTRTDPQATWREVQSIYLEPFRRAIKEGGALGVMSSYNDYDGIPIQASKLFLTDILRKEYGFKGYVVSDSGAVEFVHTKHRVATSASEAIRQSVEAGLNVRTNFQDPKIYGGMLRQLVRDGKLSTAVIDERVRDILRVKFWLGMFDAPYGDPAVAASTVRNADSMATAARAARESIVLLKNQDNVLPLSKSVKKILVTGPLADDKHGWWSRYGPQFIDFVTPLEGIRQKLGSSVDVRYKKGVDVIDARFPESDVYKELPDAGTRDRIAEAVAAAADVDVIVAVLGETEKISQESASRISLDLPGYQDDLLRALQATGKPLVLVLSNGRPLSVNWAAKNVPAIVDMWFPGEQGGAALADVLFGDYNPSGRLPITVPKSVGQIPFNFPAHPGSQGRDPGQVEGALYPFGHGLSYTSFKYSDLKVVPVQTRLGLPNAPRPLTVQVTLNVTNTGQRAGDDVVQLYLRDDYSSVTTYIKALRGFARVSLKPGETRQVSFQLTDADMALYDREQHWTVEPGRFTVMIGASSEAIKLKGQFQIAAPDGTIPDEGPVVDDRTDPI